MALVSVHFFKNIYITQPCVLFYRSTLAFSPVFQFYFCIQNYVFQIKLCTLYKDKQKSLIINIFTLTNNQQSVKKRPDAKSGLTYLDH